jgi:alkylation response protein AidB-like acyl-CoA dehydrogenase
MDLDFSPEQELLRDSVRRTVEAAGGLDLVRSLEHDVVGYSPALWSRLADLGVLGVMIDEEHGGSGMTMVDAAVVYEELGRSLVSSPHLVSCVLAAGMLNRADPASSATTLASTLLPAIAAGTSVVTIASLEPDSGFGPAGIQLAASADGDGWRLTGTKVHVPFAHAADRLLVLARSHPGRDKSGILAVLVDSDSPGVRVEQQLTVASDAQFRVSFHDVTVAAEDVVQPLGEAWKAWHDTMLDGLTLLAAQGAGGARAALGLAVEYARTREQFDKPLAAFQAISHYLADATTRVDAAEALAWEAAWERSQGGSISRLAPMAKGFACRTFRDVTATAQQIFGGNGFTVDFDIQLFFRRAKSMQLNNWDDRYLDELVAADLLDATG